MILALHPAAVAEVQEAHTYYHEKDPTLAEEFLAVLDESLELLTRFPERYPKYDHGTRRMLLKRFPYQLIYQARDERILILAVAHSRKKPSYWADR